MLSRIDGGQGLTGTSDQLYLSYGAWRSGLARMVWDHEAVGSNPTAPMDVYDQTSGVLSQRGFSALPAQGANPRSFERDKSHRPDKYGVKSLHVT